MQSIVRRIFAAFDSTVNEFANGSLRLVNSATFQTEVWRIPLTKCAHAKTDWFAARFEQEIPDEFYPGLMIGHNASSFDVFSRDFAK